MQWSESEVNQRDWILGGIVHMYCCLHRYWLYSACVHFFIFFAMSLKDIVCPSLLEWSECFLIAVVTELRKCPAGACWSDALISHSSSLQVASTPASSNPGLSHVTLGKVVWDLWNQPLVIQGQCYSGSFNPKFCRPAWKEALRSSSWGALNPFSATDCCVIPAEDIPAEEAGPPHPEHTDTVR